MYTLRTILVVSVIFLLGPLTVAAQWVQTNVPSSVTYGGVLYSFANSGTNLFAGTQYCGVFLSTDNGTSWTAVSNGLPANTVVTSFVISGGNLFAGTWKGVFLSINNGTSWWTISNGLTKSDVSSLALSGTNLFAGTYDGGVFRSTDNGGSWASVNNGLTALDVQALAIAPTGSGGTNLFAGTWGGGVFLSTDNGYSWTAVSNGLTNNLVISLALSGTNLFAGTNDGVFRSTDNGTSWSAVDSGLTNTGVHAFAVSGTNVFAGTGGGVFLSTNNGLSWSAADSGLTALDVQALAIAPTGSGGTNLFAGTNGAWVWRRPLSDMIAPVLIVPVTSFTLPQVATTDSSSLDITIHDASISALTISSLSTKTTAFHVTTSLPLTIQGDDSAKVHIVFLPSSFGTFKDTLAITSNGGTAHIPLSGSSPFPIALMSHKNLDYGMVSLGTGQTQNIVVRDSSINALSIDTIYTKTKAYKVSVSHGTVKPADSLTISMTFTPDTTGIFNDTLYIRNNSQTPLYKLPLTGSSPMPEFAVTNVLSDFTAKAGKSGTQSVRVTNGSINVLVLDSAKTQTKYFKVSTTFPDTVIKGDTASIQISFLPDSVRSYTDTLYVFSNATHLPTVMALSGTGSTPTGILREGDAIPTVYDLYQNYPNPFNPTTTIKFALPTQSQVTVTIYDILGREVKELVNDKLQAGYYHFTWDGSRYASGVYFYRIVAQSLGGDKKNFVQVKKLMLIK